MESYEVKVTLNSGNKYEINVKWSKKDCEFIAKCDEFPSLSFLHVDPYKAIKGYIFMIKKLEGDLAE